MTKASDAVPVPLTRPLSPGGDGVRGKGRSHEPKDGEGMEFRPDVISWNLTRRCHLNCAHCYLDADFRRGTRADELTTRECRDIIDQIAEVNPGALLILTGGEPLLRPDVFDIARHASNRGFLVVLATTGTLLSPEVTRRIVAAGIRGASISLHSLRPGAHDGFTRVPGSWEGAVRGAQFLHEANFPFIVQTSAMSWNADEIPAIVDFAARLGARVFDLYLLVCTGRGQGMTDISPPQQEALLARLLEIQKAREGQISISARCAPQYKRILHQADPRSPHLRAYADGCPAATHYCRITPTGDLTPCPYLPLTAGNLKVQPFAHLWQEAPLLSQLRDRSRLHGRCGRCEFRMICSGCRARAYAERRDCMAEDSACPYEPREPGREPIILDQVCTFGLAVDCTLPWTAAAQARLQSVPTFARGMVARRVERYARERGHPAITPEVLREAREKLVGAFAFTSSPHR